MCRQGHRVVYLATPPAAVRLFVALWSRMERHERASRHAHAANSKCMHMTAELGDTKSLLQDTSSQARKTNQLITSVRRRATIFQRFVV